MLEGLYVWLAHGALFLQPDPVTEEFVFVAISHQQEAINVEEAGSKAVAGFGPPQQPGKFIGLPRIHGPPGELFGQPQAQGPGWAGLGHVASFDRHAQVFVRKGKHAVAVHQAVFQRTAHRRPDCCREAFLADRFQRLQ